MRNDDNDKKSCQKATIEVISSRSSRDMNWWVPAPD